MARSLTFSTRPDVAALLAQAEAETGLHELGHRAGSEQILRRAASAGFPQQYLSDRFRDDRRLGGP